MPALGISSDMQTVENYRQHGEECRAMVRRSRSPEERAMLLKIGQTWDDLAAYRAAQIARGQVAPAPIPIDRLNASNDE
jgi:hypothetical protein